MNQYNILAGVLKRKILNFSKNICEGLKKPEQKLITNLLYGIAESESCHLSNIGRALKERITLKKTIERLSNGLRDFSPKDSGMMFDNYSEMIRKNTDNSTVYVIDISDVTKKYAKTMEGLDKVWDGSKGGVGNGYWTFEIAALTKNTKTPLPVYDRLYSVKEKGFVSQNDEVFKGLQYVSETFGKNGIRTLDRGFDGCEYYKYFLKNKEKFIIRADKTRHVRHKDKTINIMELAKQYKGKYRIDFKDKKGKTITCKIAVIPVSLPKYPNAPLNMVVVYGFGVEPMLLMTNLERDDQRLAHTITKVYLLRWRIEEYFRFKKNQYDFEDFRVRSLNAIRMLHRVVTLLTGFIGMLSEQRRESLFVMELIEISKRIYPPKKDKFMLKFFHYAIGDAFRYILQRCSSAISHFLANAPPDPQLSFFPI